MKPTAPTPINPRPSTSESLGPGCQQLQKQPSACTRTHLPSSALSRPPKPLHSRNYQRHALGPNLEGGRRAPASPLAHPPPTEGSKTRPSPVRGRCLRLSRMVEDLPSLELGPGARSDRSKRQSERMRERERETERETERDRQVLRFAKTLERRASETGFNRWEHWNRREDVESPRRSLGASRYSGFCRVQPSNKGTLLNKKPEV